MFRFKSKTISSRAPVVSDFQLILDEWTEACRERGCGNLSSSVKSEFSKRIKASGAEGTGKAKLNLSKCGLNDGQVEALVAVFGNNHSISKIDLTKNEFSTQGATAVLQLLQKQMEMVQSTPLDQRLKRVLLSEVTLGKGGGKKDAIDIDTMDKIQEACGCLQYATAQAHIRNYYLENSSPEVITMEFLCRTWSEVIGTGKFPTQSQLKTAFAATATATATQQQDAAGDSALSVSSKLQFMNTGGTMGYAEMEAVVLSGLTSKGVIRALSKQNSRDFAARSGRVEIDDIEEDLKTSNNDDSNHAKGEAVKSSPSKLMNFSTSFLDKGPSIPPIRNFDSGLDSGDFGSMDSSRKTTTATIPGNISQSNITEEISFKGSSSHPYNQQQQPQQQHHHQQQQQPQTQEQILSHAAGDDKGSETGVKSYNDSENTNAGAAPSPHPIHGEEGVESESAGDPAVSVGGEQVADSSKQSAAEEDGALEGSTERDSHLINAGDAQHSSADLSRPDSEAVPSRSLLEPRTSTLSIETGPELDDHSDTSVSAPASAPASATAYEQNTDSNDIAEGNGDTQRDGDAHETVDIIGAAAVDETAAAGDGVRVDYYRGDADVDESNEIEEVEEESTELSGVEAQKGSGLRVIADRAGSAVTSQEQEASPSEAIQAEPLDPLEPPEDHSVPEGSAPVPLTLNDPSPPADFAQCSPHTPMPLSAEAVSPAEQQRASQSCSTSIQIPTASSSHSAGASHVANTAVLAEGKPDQTRNRDRADSSGSNNSSNSNSSARYSNSESSVHSAVSASTTNPPAITPPTSIATGSATATPVAKPTAPGSLGGSSSSIGVGDGKPKTLRGKKRSNPKMLPTASSSGSSTPIGSSSSLSSKGALLGSGAGIAAMSSPATDNMSSLEAKLAALLGGNPMDSLVLLTPGVASSGATKPAANKVPKSRDPKGSGVRHPSPLNAVAKDSLSAFSDEDPESCSASSAPTPAGDTAQTGVRSESPASTRSKQSEASAKLSVRSAASTSSGTGISAGIGTSGLGSGKPRTLKGKKKSNSNMLPQSPQSPSALSRSAPAPASIPAAAAKPASSPFYSSLSLSVQAADPTTGGVKSNGVAETSSTALTPVAPPASDGEQIEREQSQPGTVAGIGEDDVNMGADAGDAASLDRQQQPTGDDRAGEDVYEFSPEELDEAPTVSHSVTSSSSLPLAVAVAAATAAVGGDTGSATSSAKSSSFTSGFGKLLLTNEIVQKILPPLPPALSVGEEGGCGITAGGKEKNSVSVLSSSNAEGKEHDRRVELHRSPRKLNTAKLSFLLRTKDPEHKPESPRQNSQAQQQPALYPVVDESHSAKGMRRSQSMYEESPASGGRRTHTRSPSPFSPAAEEVFPTFSERLQRIRSVVDLKEQQRNGGRLSSSPFSPAVKGSVGSSLSNSRGMSPAGGLRNINPSAPPTVVPIPTLASVEGQKAVRPGYVDSAAGAVGGGAVQGGVSPKKRRVGADGSGTDSGFEGSGSEWESTHERDADRGEERDYDRARENKTRASRSNPKPPVPADGFLRLQAPLTEEMDDSPLRKGKIAHTMRRGSSTAEPRIPLRPNRVSTGVAGDEERGYRARQVDGGDFDPDPLRDADAGAGASLSEREHASSFHSFDGREISYDNYHLPEDYEPSDNPLHRSSSEAISLGSRSLPLGFSASRSVSGANFSPLLKGAGRDGASPYSATTPGGGGGSNNNRNGSGVAGQKLLTNGPEREHGSGSLAPTERDTVIAAAAATAATTAGAATAIALVPPPPPPLPSSSSRRAVDDFASMPVKIVFSAAMDPDPSPLPAPSSSSFSYAGNARAAAGGGAERVGGSLKKQHAFFNSSSFAEEDAVAAASTNKTTTTAAATVGDHGDERVDEEKGEYLTDHSPVSTRHRGSDIPSGPSAFSGGKSTIPVPEKSRFLLIPESDVDPKGRPVMLSISGPKDRYETHPSALPSASHASSLDAVTADAKPVSPSSSSSPGSISASFDEAKPSSSSSPSPLLSPLTPKRAAAKRERAEFTRFPSTHNFLFDNHMHVDHFPHIRVLSLRNMKLCGQLSSLRLTEKFPRLTDLDLAFNYLEGKIDESALPSSLLRLDLSHNRLNNLSGLCSCVELVACDVSFNLIRQIDGMPPKLEILDISHNLLRSFLHLRLLALSSELRSVTVRENPITRTYRQYPLALRSMLSKLEEVDGLRVKNGAQHQFSHPAAGGGSGARGSNNVGGRVPRGGGNAGTLAGYDTPNTSFSTPASLHPASVRGSSRTQNGRPSQQQQQQQSQTGSPLRGTPGSPRYMSPTKSAERHIIPEPTGKLTNLSRKYQKKYTSAHGGKGGKTLSHAEQAKKDEKRMQLYHQKLERIEESRRASEINAKKLAESVQRGQLFGVLGGRPRKLRGHQRTGRLSTEELAKLNDRLSLPKSPPKQRRYNSETGREEVVNPVSTEREREAVISSAKVGDKKVDRKAFTPSGANAGDHMNKFPELRMRLDRNGLPQRQNGGISPPRNRGGSGGGGGARGRGSAGMGKERDSVGAAEEGRGGLNDSAWSEAKQAPLDATHQTGVSRIHTNDSSVGDVMPVHSRADVDRLFSVSSSLSRSQSTSAVEGTSAFTPINNSNNDNGSVAEEVEATAAAAEQSANLRKARSALFRTQSMSPGMLLSPQQQHQQKHLKRANSTLPAGAAAGADGGGAVSGSGGAPPLHRSRSMFGTGVSPLRRSPSTRVFGFAYNDAKKVEKARQNVHDWLKRSYAELQKGAMVLHSTFELSGHPNNIKQSINTFKEYLHPLEFYSRKDYLTAIETSVALLPHTEEQFAEVYIVRENIEKLTFLLHQLEGTFMLCVNRFFNLKKALNVLMSSEVGQYVNENVLVPNGLEYIYVQDSARVGTPETGDGYPPSGYGTGSTAARGGRSPAGEAQRSFYGQKQNEQGEQEREREPVHHRVRSGDSSITMNSLTTMTELSSNSGSISPGDHDAASRSTNQHTTVTASASASVSGTAAAGGIRNLGEDFVSAGETAATAGRSSTGVSGSPKKRLKAATEYYPSTHAPLSGSVGELGGGFGLGLGVGLAQGLPSSSTGGRVGVGEESAQFAYSVREAEDADTPFSAPRGSSGDDGLRDLAAERGDADGSRSNNESILDKMKERITNRTLESAGLRSVGLMGGAAAAVDRASMDSSAHSSEYTSGLSLPQSTTPAESSARFPSALAPGIGGSDTVSGTEAGTAVDAGLGGIGMGVGIAGKVIPNTEFVAPPHTSGRSKKRRERSQERSPSGDAAVPNAQPLPPSSTAAALPFPALHSDGDPSRSQQRSEDATAVEARLAEMGDKSYIKTTTAEIEDQEIAEVSASIDERLREERESKLEGQSCGARPEQQDQSESKKEVKRREKAEAEKCLEEEDRKDRELAQQRESTARLEEEQLEAQRRRDRAAAEEEKKQQAQAEREIAAAAAAERQALEETDRRQRIEKEKRDREQEERARISQQAKRVSAATPISPRSAGLSPAALAAKQRAREQLPGSSSPSSSSSATSSALSSPRSATTQLAEQGRERELKRAPLSAHDLLQMRMQESLSATNAAVSRALASDSVDSQENDSASPGASPSRSLARKPSRQRVGSTDTAASHTSSSSPAGSRRHGKGSEPIAEYTGEDTDWDGLLTPGTSGRAAAAAAAAAGGGGKIPSQASATAASSVAGVVGAAGASSAAGAVGSVSSLLGALGSSNGMGIAERAAQWDAISATAPIAVGVAMGKSNEYEDRETEEDEQEGKERGKTAPGQGNDANEEARRAAAAAKLRAAAAERKRAKNQPKGLGLGLGVGTAAATGATTTSVVSAAGGDGAGGGGSGSDAGSRSGTPISALTGQSAPSCGSEVDSSASGGEDMVHADTHTTALVSAGGSGKTDDVSAASSVVTHSIPPRAPVSSSSLSQEAVGSSAGGVGGGGGADDAKSTTSDGSKLSARERLRLRLKKQREQSEKEK